MIVLVKFKLTQGGELQRRLLLVDVVLLFLAYSLHVCQPLLLPSLTLYLLHL